MKNIKPWLAEGLGGCTNPKEIEALENFLGVTEGYAFGRWCPLCDRDVSGRLAHDLSCPFTVALKRVTAPKTFSVDVSATAEDVITVTAFTAEEASKIALAQLHARLSDAGLGVDNLTAHDAVEVGA